MPQSRRRSSAGNGALGNAKDLTIRIDHSSAKLENQRLKDSMSYAIEELQKRKYRRVADQTFDIKAARREANLIFNQAKMIKTTEGLWEEALNRSRNMKSSSTFQSAFSMSNPSVDKSRRKYPNRRNRPQSSGSLISASFDHSEDEKLHKTEESSILSDLESNDDKERDEEKDHVEEFVNPYRTWAQRRLRPISAFLPLDQFPVNGRFEPPKATRLVKSAQPRSRGSDAKEEHFRDSSAIANKSSASHRIKRRPLTATGDGKDAQRVRSFQHLKELVHIDSLSRARYLEARSRLLQVKNEQRVVEEKYLAERIQRFYTNVDDLVKHTKDALRGPQLVDSPFPLHLNYDNDHLNS